MDLLARARAAEHAWMRRLATTADPVLVDGERVGEVLLTEPIPRVRDHNAVVLEVGGGLDAAAVADLLDQELGARGVAHRRLYAAAEDADRWEAGLRSRGHRRDDVVVLRWPGGPLAADADVRIVAADPALAEASTRAMRGGGLADPAEPEGLVDELAWLVSAQLRAGARVLVALDDDRPVGHVRVFPGDGAAQVEELDVHPDVRRRGVGRALLVAALSRTTDAALVFLTAEAGGWQARWYERLGFQPLGRSSGFVRPADPPAP